MLISAFLYMPTLAPTPQPAEEECDWYCQLIKEASAPIPVAARAKSTPQQIGSQLAQLSDSDRSLALREAAAQLSTPLPAGNAKTSSFLTGLSKALTGITRLASKITESADLNKLPNLAPAVQSKLLLAAGSF